MGRTEPDPFELTLRQKAACEAIRALRQPHDYCVLPCSAGDCFCERLALAALVAADEVDPARELAEAVCALRDRQQEIVHRGFSSADYLELRKLNNTANAAEAEYRIAREKGAGGDASPRLSEG